MARRYTTCPWNLPDSDLVPQGDPELVRDLHQERQLALHVLGTHGVSLGLIALRCERHGELLTPLSLCIPDTPIVTMPAPAPAMNLALLSNPRRIVDYGEQ